MTTISSLPWSLKIFAAIVCDLVWPFGMRRKPYILAGFFVATVGMLAIGIGIEDFSHEAYLYAMIATNTGVVIGAVAADGYAVQLALMGKEGSKERRGWILMTAAIVRFSANVFTGVLQGFLMNGPELNGGREVKWNEAWEWGISLRSFYFINAALLVLLFIPMSIMKEIPDRRPCARRRTPSKLFVEVWGILKSKATFKLCLFSTILKFASIRNAAHYYLQSHVVGFPIFTASLEQMFGSLGLVWGVIVFRSVLIHENWRQLVLFTSIAYNVSKATLWSLAIYNIFGLRNAWFMVFTEVSTFFFRAMTWRLIGVATIEIARPGIESTCFQLLMTVSNVGRSASSVLGGHLFSLMPKVEIGSEREFVESNGERVYMNYTLLLCVIGVVASLLAAPHVPVDREMVRAWHRDSSAKTRALYGKLNVVLWPVLFWYGTLGVLLYFIPSLSCLPIFRSSECPKSA